MTISNDSSMLGAAAGSGSLRGSTVQFRVRGPGSDSWGQHGEAADFSGVFAVELINAAAWDIN